MTEAINEAGDSRYVGPSDMEKMLAVQVGSLENEIERRIETVQREAIAAATLARRDAETEHEHTVLTAARLSERLDAMDKATVVLNDIVTRVPTDVQQAVGNLRNVVDERFNSIDKQFDERDTRSERESRDNKVAVDAAFAAQKEAAAKQDESNAKAIDKSEAATTETINKLGELFTNSNKGLSDKIDDLKARVQAIESGGQGRESQQVRRDISIGQIMAMVMATLVLISIIVAVTHGFK